MENEENTTLDSLLEGDANVAPAGDQGAVSQPSAALTLEAINAALGKDFKDTETALKSIKDTSAYVGKRKEDIAKEVGGNNDELAGQIKELKENMFYKDNPQYAEYRSLIGRLGGNPEETVGSAEFKVIFDKADGFTKNQNLKSVLTSNSRLAASKDDLTRAREAMNSGNREAAEESATNAVLNLLGQ